MKNFWKKWFISASSGVLGKVLLVFFGLCAGVAGSKFISLPVDNTIIKGAGAVAAVVVILFTVMICTYVPMILEWFAYKRESDIEEINLKNTNLQLENENLKFRKSGGVVQGSVRTAD